LKKSFVFADEGWTVLSPLDEVEKILVDGSFVAIWRRPTKTLASAMPSPSVGRSEQLG
jgi:hypothetical protein